MLEVRNLTVQYARGGDRVTVVDGIDLDVAPGSTTALVGESGSGKSSAALALLGLAGPHAAVHADRLTLDGAALPPPGSPAWSALRGRSLGMVFQEPMTALNPVLPIGEQIAEVFRTHSRAGRRAARDRAIEWLARVGIPDPEQRARQYAHEFSGGMRQRVVIAMAVALEPRILIADEPTTALDVTLQAQILALLRELQERVGLGLLLISHDLSMVEHAADEVCVMYAGRIVERGATPVVLNHPRHPYTAALLACCPGRSQAARLAVIPGAMPDPQSWPAGCRFHPRCWRARSAAKPPERVPATCLTMPSLTGVGTTAGHTAACPVALETRP